MAVPVVLESRHPQRAGEATNLPGVGTLAYRVGIGGRYLLPTLGSLDRMIGE